MSRNRASGVSEAREAELAADVWLRIDELHIKFIEAEKNGASILTKLEMRKKLEGLAADYLSIVPHVRKFVSPKTGDIIANSATQMPDFSLAKASQAFRAVEQFATNLVNNPSFSQENWSIQKDSGFYQLNVKPYLVRPECLFFNMGYFLDPKNKMMLCLPSNKRKANTALAMGVARDCLLALVECQVMLKIIYCGVMTQYPIMLEEVMKLRKEHIGSVEGSMQELVYQKNQVELEKLEKEKVRLKKEQEECGRPLPSSKDTLLDFISKKIQEKEQELECPVCLVISIPPIYTCAMQHLVCAKCRARLQECPECRVPYQGNIRHRYAERAADELKSLREQKRNNSGE